MTKLMEEMDRAVSLYIRGRAEEAVEIGRGLLTRARGTPHVASVYRHMSEFLHATGDYRRSRETAREASTLARATRRSGEILAAQLMLLACDLYEGRMTSVYDQLGDLMQMAADHPMPMVFMGQVLLSIGKLDEAVELLEETRGILDDLSEPGNEPSMDLFRANLLLTQGKSHLLADRPADAAAVLERAMAYEIPTMVPGTLARAMLGLACSRCGDGASGKDYVDEAAGLARKISRDLHGHCLALSGLTRLQVGEAEIAIEQIRSGVALLTHSLDRQESFCALGEALLDTGERSEAISAYRRATEPTTDSFFGRAAVRALRNLVGFKVV